MFRALITVALIATVCFLGCRDNGGDLLDASPPDEPPTPTKDDSVLANVYLVRDAAEAFALANAGVYPDRLSDELPDGRTLIAFLPSGQWLVNPYSHLRDSPVDAHAYHQGRVGYQPYRTYSPYGYVISAVGGTQGETLVMISRDPDDQ